MRMLSCAALILALIAADASRAFAGVEAYPIPGCAQVAFGALSTGKAPPAIPGPSGKTLMVVIPRGGVANGQILLKATGGPATVSVTVSALTGPGGAIPADKDLVRYGQYITGEKTLSVYRWQKEIGLSANAAETKASAYDLTKGNWRIDCLLGGPSCEVEAEHPRVAWLTFAAGADMAPGIYKGTATVTGAGAIPLELEVVDALVPTLADSVMSNDIRPMWEVIALGNGIPLDECWKSDRFWKVTAAYLEKLGKLHQNNCGISVLAPSTTSSLGMVKWIRKGDAWSWDYAALDKFIETYRRVVGEPRMLDATAFSQDERAVGLSILCTDADTGKQSVVQMGDDDATAALAVSFIKDLTAHLATLKLDKKLALGIWFDKMSHTGGGIRKALLKEFPDLKLSLWAHHDSWGMTWKDRVALYMGKMPTEKAMTGKVWVDEKVDYPITMGYRRAFEDPTSFGPLMWDCVIRKHAGMGCIDFSNWSMDRRAKEYTYFGAGPFTSWQRQLVYPMSGEEVTTGVLFEIFREYAQDFELIAMMQAKGVKTGLFADPRAELDKVCFLDKFGRCLLTPGTNPAAVERLHWDILHQAGAEKVRPGGK